MPRTVLAIDLGTSSCKAAAYTAEGRAVASASSAYGTNQSQPGHVEQNPSDYLEAVASVRRQIGPLDIAAISFSTQTPTLIFCDADANALRPAIVWQDSRAVDEARALQQMPAEHRRAWFGMDLPISAASTPAKLLWVARHEPELWARTRYVLQPKDYAAARLTGQVATDAWCNKGVAHVHTGSIHPEWSALLHRSDSFTAPVRVSTERAGDTSDGTPVTVGLSDALAGIFSTGATLRERRGFIITGTSEIVGVGQAAGSAHKGLFEVPGYVLPGGGEGLHFGPTQAGGAAADWLARLIGRSTVELLDLVPSHPQPSPILFRPHLAGERAPYWDDSLHASFEGLRIEHGAADLTLAVLQGVALQEKLLLTCAERGSRVVDLVLAGGGARHRGWNQLRANVLQRRVLAMRDTEASLRGAALLGWAALGEIDVKSPPASWFHFDEVRPDPAWSEPSEHLLERFALPGFLAALHH